MPNVTDEKRNKQIYNRYNQLVESNKKPENEKDVKRHIKMVYATLTYEFDISKDSIERILREQKYRNRIEYLEKLLRDNKIVLKDA